jgi:hypothetical protein
MSSLVIAGDTSGSITLQAPAVAGSAVLTLPATSGTVITTTSGTAATATTATNLAGGANGTIPYQSASGTTQMLTAGTAGFVLQANGSAAPTWVAPSSGALTLLSTITASASATVDVETTFSSTYDAYLLVVSGLQVSDNNALVNCRMKLAGAYVTTTTYAYHLSLLSSFSTAYAAVAGDGVNTIQVTDSLGNSFGRGASFAMYIYTPSSTTKDKVISWTGTSIQSNGRTTTNVGGANNSAEASALTGLRFYPDVGTIASGTFRLYGIANS